MQGGGGGKRGPIKNIRGKGGKGGKEDDYSLAWENEKVRDDRRSTGKKGKGGVSTQKGRGRKKKKRGFLTPQHQAWSENGRGGGSRPSILLQKKKKEERWENVREGRGERGLAVPHLGRKKKGVSNHKKKSTRMKLLRGKEKKKKPP